MVKTAMTGAWRSLDSSETTSSRLGGTLGPTMAHGGDHLSQLSFQLTSHKLTGKNYLEWAQSVKLAIDGRGKLGHLTGDVRQPAAGDPSLSVWRSENSLIIAWLINSMEPTIGLNRDFDEVRSRILGKKPMPSLREAFSEIRREETRRKVMLTNLNPKPAVDVENSALVVKENEYDNDKKKRPWCDHCKKSWHSRVICWKIHGKHPNWKKKNGNEKIKIADGSLSTIVGTGSIVLSPSITLHNVLHVPKLSCNLLSISKLTNDLKCQANFYSTRCGFQEMVSGRMIGSVRASGGLYFFEDGTNFGKHVQSTWLKSVFDSSDVMLRHYRLGHPSTKELLVYSRRKYIQGNETDASQYCRDSVPQTIQNSIEATGDTHTNPIHLNLPSSESSQFESSMSNLDKPIAHRKDSTDGKIAILIVYVDDIILTGDDIAEMERLKQCLASKFEIKDLGSLKFFLGMEIARSRKGIAVSQKKYVLDLLKETGMSVCRPVETPIDPNQKLGDNKEDPVNTSRYQKLVGKLIYLSHTRPDIAFAVSLVSQFMHSPHEEHLEAVYRILRYLKSSPGKGLFFRKNEQRNLEAYTDADRAGSITDRKSTSGYCNFVWKNLVTWRSKKQGAAFGSQPEFLGLLVVASWDRNPTFPFMRYLKYSSTLSASPRNAPWNILVVQAFLTLSQHLSQP
ncbi:hypothetical protein RJ639_003788 [Escallonia herrerae]|uniref:Retrovirus-related Pol polyprotein from transposon RE1 n=1 Tax=Escallonia herrerae TaxID=1293975 RepID=A0AA88W0W9_9ASTE|nr:hypothetical protein RJ639_003788 [Escallonia herrerae]